MSTNNLSLDEEKKYQFMKTKKVIFLIFTVSILIELLITPFRGIMLTDSTCGIILSLLLGFIFAFFWTAFCLKKYDKILRPLRIFILVLAGLSCLHVPVRILDFSGTLGTLPDFLFHLLGALLGYIAHTKSNRIRMIIFVAGLIPCLFMFFKGYNLWRHKLSFETYTGRLDNIRRYDFQFQTATGDTLSLDSFKGRYLLLDCWYTYCGVCYVKMPKVQKLYDKYKDDNRIAIYAMHTRMSRDNRQETCATGAQILKENDYSFPCFSIDKNNPVLKTLGVDGYPTVLIFDQEGQLFFHGNIENAAKYVSKLLDDKKR
jgi:thiol-disulfide isomerase/thioredoxin